jgi:hypothetical protein
VSARIRQCPGWWPSLVEVVCDECGYRGPTHDLNKDYRATAAKIERDQHNCSDPQHERPWWR